MLVMEVKFYGVVGKVIYFMTDMNFNIVVTVTT